MAFYSMINVPIDERCFFCDAYVINSNDSNDDNNSEKIRSTTGDKIEVQGDSM